MSAMPGMSMAATSTAMAMSGMSMAATGTAAAASATSTDMSSMSMGGSSSCKVSMLWNWYTIDSCFLSTSWHVTSKGMFAGSCIGVILLVITLEFLRRAGKEYDRYILAQYSRSLAFNTANPTSTRSSSHDADATKAATTTNVTGASCGPAQKATFRPNIYQHAIRALLHMLQFAVAYFVMLLAMYYNGYIIICIFIGAYLGYFIFGWESFQVAAGGQDRLQEEVTVCCG